MKWLIRIGGALLLVLVLVVIGVIFYGGALIKEAVETAGPKITGVPITLDRAFFYPVRGQAGLAGLTVSNPEGYKTSHLMKLGEITIVAEKATIGKKDLVIRTILGI